LFRNHIPIIQISINSYLGARRNYQYGQLIASFKQENILVIGSGNISHSLQMFIDWINNKIFIPRDTQVLVLFSDINQYLLSKS